MFRERKMQKQSCHAPAHCETRLGDIGAVDRRHLPGIRRRSQHGRRMPRRRFGLELSGGVKYTTWPDGAWLKEYPSGVMKWDIPKGGDPIPGVSPGHDPRPR